MPSGGSSGRGLAGSGCLPSAGSMFWISFGLTFAFASSAASPDSAGAAVLSSDPPTPVASAAGVLQPGAPCAPPPDGGGAAAVSSAPATRVASAAGVSDAVSLWAPPEDPCEPPDDSPPQ